MTGARNADVVVYDMMKCVRFSMILSLFYPMIESLLCSNQKYVEIQKRDNTGWCFFFSDGIIDFDYMNFLMK